MAQLWRGGCPVSASWRIRRQERRSGRDSLEGGGSSGRESQMERRQDGAENGEGGKGTEQKRLVLGCNRRIEGGWPGPPHLNGKAPPEEEAGSGSTGLKFTPPSQYPQHQLLPRASQADHRRAQGWSSDCHGVQGLSQTPAS